MKILLLSIGLLFFSAAKPKPTQNFDQFCADFVGSYKILKIPDLELSYVNGLKNIGDADRVQKQLDFFNYVNSQLPKFHSVQLTASQKIDFELIKYETTLNLQRLALEQQWNSNKPAEIPTTGIISIPNSKAWYIYLLTRWLDDEVNPDEIYQFGLKEVARVQGHIEQVRGETGLNENDFYKHLNDSSFFVKNPAEMQPLFEGAKAVIYKNLHKLFSETKIDSLKIEQGTDQALAQTPGFYNENVFYYNLFDKPFNKRNVDWLFIHEGVPGHHYQASVMAHTNISPVQQLFFYTGFAEGWAAYCEELGKNVGVYKTPYDELGKWEWDIVRSVRVPMDVGLNYYGWTDEQALAFWKKNIRNQDDIAMREINRLRRWPVQAITYKYGALQILGWKETLKKKQGKDFNMKSFHDRILDHGSLPMFMVKENVFAGS
jgi:uncharacterized protein (DUF885 family)